MCVGCAGGDVRGGGVAKDGQKCGPWGEVFARVESSSGGRDRLVIDWEIFPTMP